MSYMEIYNEEINDLLAPEHRKLQIHESLEVLALFFYVAYQFVGTRLITLVFFLLCSVESTLPGCEKKLLPLLIKFSI